MKDICDWFRDFLKDGPKNVNDVRKAAMDAGYSRKEFKEGKQLCRIKTIHLKTDEWIWSLPED